MSGQGGDLKLAFEEKTISSEIVYEGPVFKIRKHLVETVNGESYRDVVEHNGGAVMLAVLDDGRIIMERQYRKALEREVLELPAGKIDPGEEPLAAAERELREETGWVSGDTRHLVSFNPSCGYAMEMLHIYVMRDLALSERELDADEDIELIYMTADELICKIMNQEIKDAKTIIGVLFARMAGEI